MIKIQVFTIIFASCFTALQANANTHMMMCDIPKEASTILSENKEISPKVLQLAFKAHDCAMRYRVPEANRRYLSIIDFSKPSNEKRFWVIDVDSKKVLYSLYVAHGKGSGLLWSRSFSDKPGSLASSIGLYLTKTTYTGGKGLSLRLEGLEPKFNDLAYRRLIVIHGARYVNQSFLRSYGRLGRSWGCPAVSESEIKPLANTIKNGALLFIYYPDKNWLAESRFLNCSVQMAKLN